MPIRLVHSSVPKRLYVLVRLAYGRTNVLIHRTDSTSTPSSNLCRARKLVRRSFSARRLPARPEGRRQIRKVDQVDVNPAIYQGAVSPLVALPCPIPTK